MDSGEPDSPSSEDERETLTAGSRHQVPRWLLVVGVLVAAVAAAVVLVQRQPSEQPAASRPQQTPPAPTMAVDRPSGGPPLARPKAADHVVVDEVGHPILGATGDWELFGYARPGTLVRIELAEGMVTRTAVPPLQSGGPVSLLVGPNGALIHPLDYVPGYTVLDGHCARPQKVRDGGLVLPGPRAGQAWVQSGDGGRLRMRLMGLDGRVIGPSLTVPFDDAWPVTADGLGYVLASGADGTYGVRAGGSHRITTGSVVAAGPTAWLLVECDGEAGCHQVVVDSGTGARRRLGKVHGSFEPGAGVISPDGGTAAVLKLSRSQRSTLHLVDLTTGADRPIDGPVGRLEPGSALAWSPDSRWLFVAADHLRAVDTEQHRLVDLGRRLGLDGITQIAVRSR